MRAPVIRAAKSDGAATFGGGAGDFAKKTLLVTTGSEAVENAVKIARAATKRSGTIAFSGAYHGRT
ncbi:aminotransferase class III-fold pyridoxal phosphate-dependent enzyme, partial [Escherichia coli]|uniref:aminotransferase class III-fold pyridoxal phosphate-dependent enzyme n=1 Tax=Escherichia coli TaxID=562 RepID=UPI0020777485